MISISQLIGLEYSRVLAAHMSFRCDCSMRITVALHQFRAEEELQVGSQFHDS
jgi:hypothetical protein